MAPRLQPHDTTRSARYAALGLLTALATLAPCAAQTQERWLLMARHGECAPISSLKRKVPDLTDVASPAAFAQFMRHKGFEVKATEIVLPKGRYWEVTVPGKELGLVFVTAELCQTVNQR